MERLKLENKKTNRQQFKRETATKTLENVLQKIKEVNRNKDFIYTITKAVLFGSYINSNKEKIGDLDIAIYLKLKDETKSEPEQNYERYIKASSNYLPFILQFYYGKEEVFRYIKNNKRIVQLHDAVEIEKESIRYNEPISYIYIDKYKIIYEMEE